ncbi:anti-sigma factor domain-containing protein [Bacillus sp. S/N-304-OC-R1]|uniref:anti-sigma factor domain-containing protein n=1 Tax=Bacillus sp. S/N-304-OC-R1 TaxID=2758034 RepID=UPI001C8EE7A0|nr:anti-sigma factor domain-containing protein [Bacillus sp. S/N-304-OC-R1]MBY0120950.1 anti-sigma factor domain-containing protein [Bacillus sp. S/N-304-OC-R1]
MKTGIIMEINERFLTLLTPDGEFLKAQKQNRQYQIGEEINFYPISEEKTSRSAFLSVFASFKAKAVLMAFVMIILICSSIFTINGNNEVYAYMSIDTIPSIELGVNDKFQVIEISPYNEEGKEIVKQIPNWKNKSVKEVTAQIIRQIKNQGYTKDNYEIVIATVNTQKENKALETKWEREVTEIKETIQNEQLAVKVMDATPKEREKAKENGLSVGSFKETKLKNEPDNVSGTQKPNINENKKVYQKDDSKHSKDDQNQAEYKNKGHNNNNNNNNNNRPATPPGQVKKEQNLNQTNGGYKQGNQQTDKKIPPGQEKKQERINNQNGNNLEKYHKSNNENKLINKNQSNYDDKFPHGNGKENSKWNNKKHNEKQNSNQKGKEKKNHGHQDD